MGFERVLSRLARFQQRTKTFLGYGWVAFGRWVFLSGPAWNSVARESLIQWGVVEGEVRGSLLPVRGQPHAQRKH